MGSNFRKTVELSDDWHQDAYGPDEPMGYAVADGEGEHRIFQSRFEAERFAEEVEDEHPECGDVLIYPLLAANGLSRTEMPRCWRLPKSSRDENKESHA